MPADIPPITDSYPADTELMAEAVHRIDHRTAQDSKRLAELAALVAELAEDWAAFKPIAEAFGRGGILAARTAARRNGRARDA